MDDQSWTCVACGHDNTLSLDAFECHRSDDFKCERCGKRHYLEVHVEFEIEEVMDADKVDAEDRGREEQKKYRNLLISSDRGVTWSERKAKSVTSRPRPPKSRLEIG